MYIYSLGQLPVDVGLQRCMYVRMHACMLRHIQYGPAACACGPIRVYKCVHMCVYTYTSYSRKQTRKLSLPWATTTCVPICSPAPASRNQPTSKRIFGRAERIKTCIQAHFQTTVETKIPSPDSRAGSVCPRLRSVQGRAWPGQGGDSVVVHQHVSDGVFFYLCIV